MAPPKVKQIGKYDVVDIVGRGGMGVVYKAIDPSIGRTVAIKMMTGAFADDPDLLSRFYREARSTGNLQHPNIVTVHDLGDQDGTPYLVMEFLEGESLEKIILARRPMSLIDKIGLMIEVCEGLHYAHARTVIHRDIKPANIVILKNASIKIVDFGIARMGNDGMTRPGQVVGSIQFMSPEQINAGQVDCRSDIFSAGIVLYQLLAYELPFEGKDTGSTLLKILNEPPKSLSSILPECPRELEDIVNKALAKEPVDRYSTAEEMAFDLMRLQESLKQHVIADSLADVESLMTQQEWSKAKDVVQSVLKLDRKHNKANEYYKEIQQVINKQARSAEAEQLRVLAEQALKANKLDDAIAHLERAMALDQGNTEAFNLHKQVKDAKERAARVEQAMKRAESAVYAGDLEEARQALEEALDLKPDNEEARSLKAQVEQRIGDAIKQKQLQRVVDEARKQIASRKFTAALETLDQAVTLGATTTTLQELMAIARAGREQEKRRRELEQLTTDVQDALNSDDYKSAFAKVEDGLHRFPNDSGLLKLRLLAESQREIAHKRQEIERIIGDARKFTEAGKAAEALSILNAAAVKHPGETNLQALHAIVAETLAREEQKRRKDTYVQSAKENIRNKKYGDAIRILEEASADFGPAEFESLLRYAEDERAAHDRRQAIEKLADQAQKLAEADEFDQAVKLLEDAMKGGPDEELNIVLADVRRAAADYETRVSECVDTAHRLIRSRKAVEAVKFLESQPANVQRNRTFQETLAIAQHEQVRLQALFQAEKAAREALKRQEFEAVEDALREGFKVSPEDAGLSAIRSELQAKRVERAKIALQKALKDSRMMLLVRSYESAIEILDQAAPSLNFAPPELAAEHAQLRKQAVTGIADRSRQSVANPVQPAERSGTAVGGWDHDVTTVESANTVAATARESDLAVLSKLAAQAQTIVGLPELTGVFNTATSISQKYPDDPAVASLVQTISGRVHEVEAPKASAAAAATVERPVVTSAPAPVASPKIGAVPEPKRPVKVIEQEAKAVHVSPPSPPAKVEPKPAEKAKEQQKKNEKGNGRTAAPAKQVGKPEQPKPPAEVRAPAPAAAPQAPPVQAPKPAAESPKKDTREARKETLTTPASAGVPAGHAKLYAGIAAAVLVIVIAFVAIPKKEAPKVKEPATATIAPSSTVPASPPASRETIPVAPHTARETVPVAPQANANPQPNAPAEAAPSPAPAQLRIVGIDSTTTVVIDGRNAGSAARNGTFGAAVAAGDHVIELQRAGYQSKSLRRTLTAGKTLTLGQTDVQLQKLAQPAAPSVAATSAPATPVVNEAQEEWNRISRSNDVAALEQFARRYPSSPYAAEATRKAEDIVRRTVTAQPSSPPQVPAANPVNVPPAPATSKPAVDTASGDRQGVIGALSRYTSAYQNRSAAALAQVWPTLKKNELKKIGDSFKSASSIRMSLKPLADPVIGGDEATVTCSRTLQYTFSQGSPKPLEDQVTIHLRRENGVWVLQSVQ
jgi:eukaryotic-like serine/threonine-protein kinase